MQSLESVAQAFSHASPDVGAIIIIKKINKERLKHHTSTKNGFDDHVVDGDDDDNDDNVDDDNIGDDDDDDDDDDAEEEKRGGEGEQLTRKNLHLLHDRGNHFHL